MRTCTLKKEIYSNIDLVEFANSRVQIKFLGDSQYLITSSLKFYACELNSFVIRFLKNQTKGKYKLKYIKGQCSCPYGVVFE